jgi:hypothetical protein
LLSGVTAARAILEGVSAQEFQSAFLARRRTQLAWANAVDATFKSSPARTLSVAATAALPSLARLAANLTRVRGVAELTGFHAMQSPGA